MTSDGNRQQWEVQGPLFAAGVIDHWEGSPADPNRLFLAQWGGWFGQVVQRSSDGGKTWERVGSQCACVGEAATHEWYAATSRPWAFKRVWHLEPSLSFPNAG